MNPRTSEYRSVLLAEHPAPCLSLYEPTHFRQPDRRQDPIRFKNLVKALDESLRHDYKASETDELLAPFHALEDDHAFWNRGATLVFGYDVAEVIGQSLDIIIPERLRRAHWEGFDHSLETGTTKHTDRVLTTRAVHKDGRAIYVDLAFGLVKDDAGRAVGAFATGRDCTQRYLAERAAKTRLHELEAAAGKGDDPAPKM